MSFRTLVVGTAFISAASLAACNDGSVALAPVPRQPQAVFATWCNGLEPEWVAVQDGDSAWKRLQPIGANGKVTFHYDFTSDRAAIAMFKQQGGGLTTLSVLFGAPEELATVGITKPLFCATPVSKVLLGGIIGVDTNEVVMMAGDLSQDNSPWGGGGFALANISEGPHDVIAVRSSRTNGQSTVTGFILRRDVDLPDSTYMPVVDFASNETITPASNALAVNGIGTDNATTSMRLITPTSEVRISPIQSGTQVVSRVVKALPIDKLRAGDLQVVQAQASGSNGPRMVQQFFRTPTDWALTLPAAILKPAVTSVATAPLLRLKAHFAEQADYDRLATMVYQQGPNTQVVVSMTAAFAALNGGYDLVVPDLAAAPGFDPAWGLHAGTSVLWNAVRIGGTLGLGVDAVPADGLVQRLGQTIGSIP